MPDNLMDCDLLPDISNFDRYSTLFSSQKLCVDFDDRFTDGFTTIDLATRAMEFSWKKYDEITGDKFQEILTRLVWVERDILCREAIIDRQEVGIGRRKTVSLATVKQDLHVNIMPVCFRAKLVRRSRRHFLDEHENVIALDRIAPDRQVVEIKRQCAFDCLDKQAGQRFLVEMPMRKRAGDHNIYPDEGRFQASKAMKL